MRMLSLYLAKPNDLVRDDTFFVAADTKEEATEITDKYWGSSDSDRRFEYFFMTAWPMAQKELKGVYIRPNDIIRQP